MRSSSSLSAGLGAFYEEKRGALRMIPRRHPAKVPTTGMVMTQLQEVKEDCQ